MLETEEMTALKEAKAHLVRALRAQQGIAAAAADLRGVHVAQGASKACARARLDDFTTGVIWSLQFAERAVPDVTLACMVAERTLAQALRAEEPEAVETAAAALVRVLVAQRELAEGEVEALSLCEAQTYVKGFLAGVLWYQKV